MKPSSLPEIPVLDAGLDWPNEVLDRQFDRAHALLTESGGRIPQLAVRLADAVSRRWLERWHQGYLDEIDRISARIARPGAYFLNVSYEWGCTTWAGPSPDCRSVRLIRTLDWPDRGLGRYVVAVRVSGAAGSWLTLTWPGFTGILQAVAPGRFAAALNQAPMERSTGLYLADWTFSLGVEAAASNAGTPVAPGFRESPGFSRGQSDAVEHAGGVADDLHSGRRPAW